jgi:hypothetical protein
MKIREISPLAVFTTLIIVLAAGSEIVSAAPTENCFLIVTERWPLGTKSDPNSLAQARSRIFDDIGILLDAAYRNGGYVRNPTAFPVHHTDFRNDQIVFDFRTDCSRARMFLVELIQAYTRRLSTKQQVGPDLVILNRPANEYEARCGVGATARTCRLN